MLRGENLRTAREASTYKTILWQSRVDEGAIVDYSTFEKAEAAGFPAEALVDDAHDRCQEEANRLRKLGAGGILSPSAALPGSTNLTIFGPRVEVAWGTEITLAAMVAVQRLTEGSAPPELITRVRYFGDTHEGLAEYQAAQQRLFRMPRRRPPQSD